MQFTSRIISKTILAKKQEIEYNNIRSAAVWLLCKVLAHLRKRKGAANTFPTLHFLFSHAYYISFCFILQDVLAEILKNILRI